jgi:beta-aspartyl-peptidase (threonine type)
VKGDIHIDHTIPVLVVHGGAWEIQKRELKAHRCGIKQALETGWEILQQGGTALDAVESVIVVLEDDPTFDAGRGSILNTDGSIEMDASIMDGKNLDAGAVAALRNFPNPVRVARRILEKTQHILLAGDGCVQFALKEGFRPVSIRELLTTRELRRLEHLMKDDQFEGLHAFGKKRGTVGAVAMDRDRNLAAGTSTGGTPKKIPGRVGDTPLIGCGTYAENRVGGVSCTGWGEAIIKLMLAKTLADLMKDRPAQKAAEESIDLLASKAGGLGGVICLSGQGEIGCAFNTPRMAWGYMRSGMEKPEVFV